MFGKQHYNGRGKKLQTDQRHEELLKLRSIFFLTLIFWTGRLRCELITVLRAVQFGFTLLRLRKVEPDAIISSVINK